MPSSTASRSRALTTSAPARWPSMTGSPRAVAQRPLPSVMMATYRGVIANAQRSRKAIAQRLPSDLHDLGLFGLQVRLEVADLVVGHLLQLGLGSALLVLPHVAALAQLAQVVHDVAAHVADLDPAVLGQAVHHLDELAPALLGQ